MRIKMVRSEFDKIYHNLEIQLPIDLSSNQMGLKSGLLSDIVAERNTRPIKQKGGNSQLSNKARNYSPIRIIFTSSSN